MSNEDFLLNSNIQLIWDIIIDEGILQNKTKNTLNQIVDFFNFSIKDFFEKERKNTSNLIELNKKYILFFIQYIRIQYPSSKVNVQKKQAQPLELTQKLESLQSTQQRQTQTLDKNLVTFEELQKERISKFEQDLLQKQQDFTNFMDVRVPEKPNFSDPMDSPLDKTDILIQRTIQQRNLEAEQYKNNTTNKEVLDIWLQPQTTSIKKENSIENDKSIKYIKIGHEEIVNHIKQNEIIELHPSKPLQGTENSKSILKKNISWQDQEIPIHLDIMETSSNFTFETNLLNKFKRLENTKIERNDIDSELVSIKDQIKTISIKIDDLTTCLNKIYGLFEDKIKNI